MFTASHSNQDGRTDVLFDTKQEGIDWLRARAFEDLNAAMDVAHTDADADALERSFRQKARLAGIIDGLDQQTRDDAMAEHPYPQWISSTGQSVFRVRSGDHRMITHQQMADLVATSLEGGSTFWIDNYSLLDAASLKSQCEVLPIYADANYWKLGGRMQVTRDEESGEPETCIFDRVSLESAMRRIPSDMRAEILDDNHDAESADALIQQAALGELVYG